jgi:predicted AAA+ superfamily ATPase
MQRYLSELIIKDLDNKIVLISGPRQAGKTTIARSFYKDSSYFNFDNAEDRLALQKQEWRRDSPLLIFDELHKMKEWKRWIKGIYDTEGNRPRLLVTGSANLESYSKMGDSLAGRYFLFRLHPIDIKEGVDFWQDDAKIVFDRLMQFSGFPEPFLAGSERHYKRWQRTHLDIMLRQDFLDIKSVHTIQSIETLVALLSTRVASNISYANLARDLEVDPKTIKSWLILLENLYIIFTVSPYYKNIARSLLKKPKCFFFDHGRVLDLGQRLENLVACTLKKQCHFIEDNLAIRAELYFLRTKDGQELDFLITLNDKPCLAIEVKTSDDSASKAFAHFDQYLEGIHKYQLVLNLKREKDTPSGVKIRNLVSWLAQIDLSLYITP